MATDIFDQVAGDTSATTATATPQQQGDIFDQVASDRPTAATPAPAKDIFDQVAPDPPSTTPESDKAIAEDHSAQWNRERAQSLQAATSAGIQVGQGAGPRDILIDAISRSEKAGYPVQHFIGSASEQTGDRAPTMDIENLVKALRQREAKDPSVAPERQYWENELKQGMTAEQWRQQTGEPDPQYPSQYDRFIPQTSTTAEEAAMARGIEQKYPAVGAAVSAALETAKGFIPRSVSDVIGFVTPVQESVHALHQGYDVARKVVAGEPLEQAEREVMPETFQLKDAEQTPAFSKERFAAGFNILAQMLTAAGAVKGIREGGEIGAIKKGDQPVSDTGEHPRVPQRQDVPADVEEVRQGEGGPAGDRGGVQPGAEVPKIAGPALVGPDGAVLEQGQAGDTHADLLKRAIGQPHEDAALTAFQNDAQHVFTDTNGNVLDRTQAMERAKATGQVPADIQTDKLQSEHLQPEEVIPSGREEESKGQAEEGREVGADGGLEGQKVSGGRVDVMKLAGEGGAPPPEPPEVKVADSLQNTPRTTQTPPQAAPPAVNAGNGGATPPPPNSLYSPNTPPGGNPHQIYAGRVAKTFINWWERFWPRTYQVLRQAPDSNVISEHQQFLSSQVESLKGFTEQPFWKPLQKRTEQELINMEDWAVKTYRQHVANGVAPDQARQAVYNGLPTDVADMMKYRDSRVPIEKTSSQILDVPEPSYTGDPYVARLTNEEGKAVVDLHPQMSNLGRQLRTTIGSFDNSRTHLTMKDGIAKDTQYDPIRKAVLLRELTSSRLEATAKMLENLKGKVLFDTKADALTANRALPKPTGEVVKVRGFGGKDYWARTKSEGIFLEQNLNTGSGKSALGRLVQLTNTYVRNPSLLNPLPHTTKNMFFKYIMARVGNATLKADVASFKSATPASLRGRFEAVMPMTDSGERVPQIIAKEVGNWAEKISNKAMVINKPSSKFIFGQADPAMRYALWKSYIRKGMPDQEAANHVWLDLVRYDENSGGMNFWKQIPFNFFVPWRTGTYVTLAKAFRAHPIRAALFVGAVEYLREARYRSSGRWTHLPTDYLDAPLAEAIESGTKVKDVRTGAKAAEHSAAIAATTLLFGPGGGQAPSQIKDVMEAMQGDPGQRSRILNMFWGLSQIYNMPREWTAYKRDGNNQHLVNLLTNAAISEHSALKYEPRRLMKWLPEWMPLMQKSQLVTQAEALQAKIEAKREKGQETYEARHGVGRTFQYTPEEQQLEELSRAAGIREHVRPTRPTGPRARPLRPSAVAQ